MFSLLLDPLPCSDFEYECEANKRDAIYPKCIPSSYLCDAEDDCTGKKQIIQQLLRMGQYKKGFTAIRRQRCKQISSLFPQFLNNLFLVERALSMTQLIQSLTSWPEGQTPSKGSSVTIWVVPSVLIIFYSLLWIMAALSTGVQDILTVKEVM